MPGATGDLTARLPVPLVGLYGPAATDAAARVADAVSSSPSSSAAAHVATVDTTMAAAGAPNSTACLGAGTCAPIGGHSVWGAFPRVETPPLSAAVPPTPPPLILITAASDSRQLLHGGTAGAGGLSGLAAALAGVEALANATRPAHPGGKWALPARVAVAALAAERWGYLGSRRLLYEARAREGGQNATATAGDDAAGGLPLSHVSLLIDVGAVGDASPTTTNASALPRLWLHASVTNGSKEAAVAAAAAVAAVANASVATTAPGPPPSTLWPFALAAPTIPALALTAHETSLGGPHWASRWDDARRLDVGAVAAAAAAVARAAAAAAGAPDAAANITAATVRPRVEEIFACIAWKTPGLGGCRLARALLGARGRARGGRSRHGPPPRRPSLHPHRRPPKP